MPRNSISATSCRTLSTGWDLRWCTISPSDALAPTGLSIAMWRVLAVLPGNGEQRQIDLAEMTSIDASTLSRLVTRLVELGLVTRRRSTSSSREVVVDLTPNGRELVGRLIPIAQELEQTAIVGVPPKDLGHRPAFAAPDV